METRKLIKSGPSSLVVSLPTWWIKNQDLKKGSQVDISSSNQGLFIASRIKEEEKITKRKYAIKSEEQYVIEEELFYCFLQNVEEITIPLKATGLVQSLLSKIPGAELKMHDHQAYIYNYFKKEGIDPRAEIRYAFTVAKEVFQKITVLKNEEEAAEMITLLKNMKRRILISTSLVNNWLVDPQSRIESKLTLTEIIQLKLLLQEIPYLLNTEIELIPKAVSFEIKKMHSLFKESESYFLNNSVFEEKRNDLTIKKIISLRSKIDLFTQHLFEIKSSEERVILNNLITTLRSLERLSSLSQPFLP